MLERGVPSRKLHPGGMPFTIEAEPLHPLQHIQYGLGSSGNPRWANCAMVSDCG